MSVVCARKLFLYVSSTEISKLSHKKTFSADYLTNSQQIDAVSQAVKALEALSNKNAPDEPVTAATF